MNIKSEISRQKHWLTNVFLFLQVPAFLILLMVLFVKLKFDIDTGNLTRDSNAVAGQPLYIGMVSNLGILFWCASSAITLFAGSFQKKKGMVSMDSFLTYSGILSLVLLIDDLFQLHEDFFPNNLHLPELSILMVYGVLVVIVFLRHIHILPSTNYLILLICLGLFGISLAVDIFDPEFPGESLMEDGAKFAGVLTWFGYYASVSYEHLRKKISVQ